MHFWRPYWWRLVHGLLSVTKVSQVWLNVSHSWIHVQGKHSVCFLQSFVMVLGGSMVVKKGALSLLGSWFQLLDLILFIKSVPLRKCYLLHVVCEPNILGFVEARAWALQLDQRAVCFCLWPSIMFASKSNSPCKCIPGKRKHPHSLRLLSGYQGKETVFLPSLFSKTCLWKKALWFWVVKYTVFTVFGELIQKAKKVLRRWNNKNNSLCLYTDVQGNNYHFPHV